MTTHMSFIHLTDLHFLPAGEPYHTVDTNARARQVLAHVRGLELRPAFFVISGDLADDGSTAAYVRLRTFCSEIESEFAVPVLVGLGNHDDRVNFRNVYLDEPGTDRNARFYYARQIGALRVIVLDTVVAGEVGGTLDDAQLAWLATELAKPAAGKTLLVLHHAPVPISLPGFSAEQLREPERLARVIAPHAASIAGALYGHIHYLNAGLLGGVLCASAPAAGAMLRPDSQGDIQFYDGLGYNLCHIRNDQLLINPIVLPHTGRALP